MAGKRKYNELSVAQKLEVIREVDKKVKSKTDIAKFFNIPASTLSTFLKNRANIEKIAEDGFEIRKKKRMRTAKYEDVESELFEWFSQARLNNIPISGPLVKEKADLIALKKGIDDFKCSNGWLQRFQKRHNIVSLCVRGEAASVDITAAENWRESMKPILDQYSPRDTFNMDETGVFYNLLPDRTLALKGETCHGGKRSKERITVLLCCNSDGTEKLKPLVIGKFQNPRCMKGVHHLPCDYKANKNAWVTAILFREWLLKFERKMACKDRNVLLLMDRCAAHNAEGVELNNVRVLFLPANTTSYMQPLDQGIINHLKVTYRKRLVQYLLREMSRDIPVSDIRKWNVLDAMRAVVFAWDAIPAAVIANCFTKGGFGCRPRPNNEDTAEEAPAERDDISEDWEVLRERMDCSINFEDFVRIDEHVATDAMQQTTEIPCRPTTSTATPNEEIGLPVQTNESESSDEEAELDQERVSVTRASAFNALATLHSVLDDHVEEANESIIAAVNKIESFITKVLGLKPKIKQTTIDSFFK